METEKVSIQETSGETVSKETNHSQADSSSTTPPEASRPRRTANYKVGNKNAHGSKIKRVYLSSPDYVVYRTKVGMAVFIDEDDLPREKREYYKQFLKIEGELARVYSLEPEALRRAESINKQTARAIKQCLEGNLDTARLLLQDAERRLIRLRRLQGRLEYLTSALLMLGVTLTALLIVKYFSSIPSKAPEILPYLTLASCGAIGGLLSVALGVWTLDIDMDASSLLNVIAGGSRIAIAEIASIVTLFLVKANIILGALGSGDSLYGLYVAGVVAGFSEGFVPNVMQRISHQEEEHSPTKNKNAIQTSENSQENTASLTSGLQPDARSARAADARR